MVIRWSRVVASLLAAAATGAVTGAAWASDERAVQPVWAPPAACPISADHVIANGGLQRSRAAIADRRLVILAVGSSSIEGVGASRPDLGFVPRLDAALKRRLPEVGVVVYNRGIGGETAEDTVKRLPRELELTQPDLVLWQLGTNDVLRDRDPGAFLRDLLWGDYLLARAGVDTLLIDPQRLPDDARNPAFAGRNPALEQTASVIEAQAALANRAVLRRFAAMRDWSGLAGGGVGPDELHLNDEGYACWAEITAEGLARAILDASNP